MPPKCFPQTEKNREKTKKTKQKNKIKMRTSSYIENMNITHNYIPDYAFKRYFEHIYNSHTIIPSNQYQYKQWNTKCDPKYNKTNPNFKPFGHGQTKIHKCQMCISTPPLEICWWNIVYHEHWQFWWLLCGILFFCANSELFIVFNVFSNKIIYFKYKNILSFKNLKKHNSSQNIHAFTILL